MQGGPLADAGLKELVAFACPTLNITEQPVSERYTLGHEIGCGSYGRAVLAHRNEDGLQVVVKQIRLLDMDDKARLDTVTEAKVLAQFNHVNIVHYYECLLEGGVLNIVMEYANGGDLAATIQRRQEEKKPFSEDEIMFWFVQVVLALYHVHGKKVLHRDLKSQNIFIAEGNLLKLGDFGIARVLNSDTELARTVVGSPYYLSPEICEDRPYNRKSDIWSLGCVLYELATLRRAFDGHSLPALVVKILRGKYPPVPTRYSSGLRGLIETMLKQNPKDRPSADKILRSDFVRQHLERYAAHVMSLGLGLKPDDRATAHGSDGSAAAAAAAALGLAELTAAEVRPRPSPGVHIAPRPSVSRPPRAPSVPGGTPGPPPPPSCAALSPAVAAGEGGAVVAAGPAGLGVGVGAAGEAEHSSSYDVSEAETSSSTPVDGCSPCKKPQPAARSKGLVSSGWVQRQQAALAQLAGALRAQKAGGAAGGPSGAGERDGQSPADGCGLEAGPSAPPGGVVGGNATVAAGGAGATAAKAKLAELRLQRDSELEAQRRAILARREQKKVAAERRMHKAAVAVNNRAAERQREIERHLAEQKAETEAKAAKAMQLAAAIKSKEEARRREQEVAAQHIHAHREQLRAVKSHINKEQLSELGAQFKARMANALSAGASGGGEAAVGSAQVLVVDFRAAGSVKASPARGGGRASSGPDCDAGGGISGGFPAKRRSAGQVGGPGPPPRAVRGASSATDGDGGLGVSGRGKPLIEPPWKQRQRQGKSVDFPDVQIFTPFGSDATPSPPQGAGHEGGGGGIEDGAEDEGSGGASTPDEEEEQAAAGVLEVLAQIQNVLEESEDGDGEGNYGPAAGGTSRVPPSAHSRSDDDDDEVADGVAGGGGAASATNRQPQSAAAAAAANAHKIEQLRMELEQRLGTTSFLAAYRCLRELQDRADDGDTDGGSSNVGAGGSVSTATMQDELQRLLGANGHLARLLQRLVTLEDAVFA